MARGCSRKHTRHIKLALEGKITCGGEPIPTCVECQNKDKGDARPWLHGHCITGEDCVCGMNLCTCKK